MVEIKKNRKVVMLVVTESCNLKCSYCYQSSKSKKTMPIDLAKEKLANCFNDLENFDEIEIDLFGGEPFLNPNFIIELVEWTKKQKFNKPFIFFASTNGTKIHGEIQDWLIKNKDFIWLSLSIDGNSETQNLNRSNSYSKIDLEFFRKTYPLQDVRMTINEITLNNLFDNIKHLHDCGFIVTAAFAQDIEWLNEDNEKKLITEVRKLCDYYIKNPQIKVCSLLDIYLPIILTREKDNLQKKSNWCGSGTSIKAIDIEGNEYPCQIFLPSSMPNTSEWKSLDFLKTDCFRSDDCSNCLIQNICGTCLGINLRARGLVSKRDPSLCEFNKILALGSSYLLGKKFAKGNFGQYKLKSEQIEAIESIKLIQQAYSADYKL